MDTVENALFRAIVGINKHAVRKLINPGAHKFMVRYLERARNRGAVKQAKLFFGGDMNVVLPEVISEAIYTYGVFDEIVTWLAIKHVKEGDVVLDIGAHFGYFSLLFSHLVGGRGMVFAFEPTPSTFSILQKNASALGNITALNLAVGSEAGECVISDYGLKYSAWNTLAEQSRMPSVLHRVSTQRVKVRSVRLDEFLIGHGIEPAVVKIDTENFEDEVVTGLGDTIAKCQPKILLEAGSENAMRAASKLVASGYVPQVSDGPGSLFVWTRSLEEANRRYKDILFCPTAISVG